VTKKLIGPEGGALAQALSSAAAAKAVVVTARVRGIGISSELGRGAEEKERRIIACATRAAIRYSHPMPPPSERRAARRPVLLSAKRVAIMSNRLQLGTTLRRRRGAERRPSLCPSRRCASLTT
jgi:hypothetical protein